MVEFHENDGNVIKIGQNDGNVIKNGRNWTKWVKMKCEMDMMKSQNWVKMMKILSIFKKSAKECTFFLESVNTASFKGSVEGRRNRKVTFTGMS